MSRSVRDLRDLICVSRLTYRESDNEDFDSDEGEITQDFDGLSLTSSGSDTPSTKLKDVACTLSPDSGILTTGSSTESKNTPNGSKPGSKKKRRKKITAVKVNHDLPKASPLPPLELKSDLSINSEFRNVYKSTNKKVNFDHMMCYMDASIVAGWLTRANESVEHLAKFCNSEDNFVQFAHFWLSEFPDVQKQEIYELEFNILTEEINLAFSVGTDSKQVFHSDILDLVSALFREYPDKLLSSKGPHLFLNYFDVMSSERRDQYKNLLSDVRCSTRNRQYAQWLLAIRSFALVNVWSAVTNFYRNLHGSHSKKSLLLPTHVSHQSVHQQRFYQAIRCGYVDVLHYLIVNGHVNPYHIDSHNRTYLFSAVMNNKPTVIKYLLHRVSPAIDVNVPCDTGNTALHAAANSGHHRIVSELLTSKDIIIDSINKQCDSATPLHLAILHGHVKVVELLAKAGADINCKLGDLTPIQIAADFSHDEMVTLLKM